MTLGDRVTRYRQRTGQIKGSLAHRKGNRGEKYFQTCKFLLMSLSNKVQLAQLAYRFVSGLSSKADKVLSS